MSASGQNRKSATTIPMSALPPKAEVSLSRFDVRYVLILLQNYFRAGELSPLENLIPSCRQ